jgi:hypothetical protein
MKISGIRIDQVDLPLHEGSYLPAYASGARTGIAELAPPIPLRA